MPLLGDSSAQLFALQIHCPSNQSVNQVISCRACPERTVCERNIHERKVHERTIRERNVLVVVCVNAKLWIAIAVSGR